MTLFIVVLASLLVIIIAGHQASRAQWNGIYINWIDGLVRLLCRYVHRLPDTKIDLPEQGGALVVANHVSGLDPFLLISACQRPLRFLIAREEYERPLLKWLFKAAGCIPVDRSGSPELALRQALRALQSGEVIALFPHGKIHLDSDPPRKLKAGFARLAAWANVPIHPVRIDGVSGQGHVALAPFMPSRVQLTLRQTLLCNTESMDECISKVARFIETANINQS
ncbi:MAG: lysophospholipid acyltransferase family protein [Gammaproteobacteria bacterium]|nr:lysophospholipid acyltransferase family protein [Gammaproteobacteria bacterium]